MTTSKAWPTVDRGDGRVEIVCPHGVGHPSKVLSAPATWQDWMGVHGCDNCCTLAAYALSEMIHTTKLKDRPDVNA